MKELSRRVLAVGTAAVLLGCTPTALAAAWILRLPQSMQVVVGTTKETRVREAAKAADITLSREDWYALYRAAGNKLP